MTNGESWLMDPQTRDYVQDANGMPVITRGLEMPAFFRSTIPRQGWLYAPNDLYGSDYRREKRKQGSGAASTMRGVGQRALKPLIDDGRAQSVAVTPSQLPRTGVEIDVMLVDASGNSQQIRGLNPVGLG